MNMKFAWRRTIIILLVLVGVIVSGIAVQAQDKPARTFYESLDLSTPENAVKTFADAFAKEDFPTVFMILAPKTQQRWMALFQTFAMDQLVQPDYAKQSLKNIPKFDDWESMEYSFVFDSVMMDAAQNDAYLIDLSGAVSVESSKEITLDDGQAVDVTATVDGVDGDVMFRLVQSQSGRWRVLQVIVPNGDETRFPWAVPDPDKTE